MKKTILGLIFILAFGLLAVNPVAAQNLVGARAAGMGGASSALCYDLTAAYYNPAGLAHTEKPMIEAGLGLNTSDPGNLFTVISAATDPANFIMNNYSKSLNTNGSFNALLGKSFDLARNKIGLTILPGGNMAFNKNANTLAASGSADWSYNGILTLSRKTVFIFPELCIGANLKYIGGGTGTLNVTQTMSTFTGTEQWTVDSGFGVDLGALAYISTPVTPNLAVSFTARNLAQTVTTSTKQSTLTGEAISQRYVQGPVQDLGSTTSTVDPVYVTGAGLTLPLTGTTLAVDIENGVGYTNTHAGLEHPLLGGLVFIRAGLASGPGLSLTTFGAQLGAPAVPVNLAVVLNNNDPRNSSFYIDIKAAI